MDNHQIFFNQKWKTKSKKQLLQNVSVDKNDIIALMKLINLGIELETRALPHDERNDISLMIKKEAETL